MKFSNGFFKTDSAIRRNERTDGVFFVSTNLMRENVRNITIMNYSDDTKMRIELTEAEAIKLGRMLLRQYDQIDT